jgi:hypothetical protein
MIVTRAAAQGDPADERNAPTPQHAARAPRIHHDGNAGRTTDKVQSTTKLRFRASPYRVHDRHVNEIESSFSSRDSLTFRVAMPSCSSMFGRLRLETIHLTRENSGDVLTMLGCY